MNKNIETTEVKNQKSSNARLLALQVIDNVFTNGAYANIALGKVLSKAHLGEQDRRFVTELVYGSIKAKGTIDWLLRQQVSRPLTKISPKILNILRLAVFQIYYLERIPESAACNEAVKLAKKVGHAGTVKFVNGVLRNLIRNQDKLNFPSIEDNSILHLALATMHPEWLVKRWLAEYGLDETKALCAFNNEIAPLSIRTNTLRLERESLATKLSAEGWEVKPSAWNKDGLICSKITSLDIAFKKYGQAFYIQDESSMLVADVVAPKSGEEILDLCAAPGGKTTHLAQVMDNDGHIIASDIHEHKLKLIEENAKRLGIDIIEPLLFDATVDNQKWHSRFDRVLVDAPCSGLGVLRRRAEARWTKNEKDLVQFPLVQRQILDHAAKYLKPGGLLVYSTCTIVKEENSDVIVDFLAKHKDFEYAGITHPLTAVQSNELQLLPHRDRVDGFYICALRKKEEAI